MEFITEPQGQVLNRVASTLVGFMGTYHDGLPADFKASLFGALERGGIHFIELRLSGVRYAWSIGVIAADGETRVPLAAVDQPDAALHAAGEDLLAVLSGWQKQLTEAEKQGLWQVLSAGAEFYVELQLGLRAAGSWVIGTVGAGDASRMPLAVLPVVGVPRVLH